MPRNLALFDVYVPTIIMVFVAGALATWMVDRLLASTALYKWVWHPALFRASLLACIFGLLELLVYR